MKNVKRSLSCRKQVHYSPAKNTYTTIQHQNNFKLFYEIICHDTEIKSSKSEKRKINFDEIYRRSYTKRQTTEFLENQFCDDDKINK